MTQDNSSILFQLGLVRNLLLRTIGVLIFFFAVLTFYQESIYIFVANPLMQFLPDNSSMIATGVASPFLTPLKLSFYVALFLVVPYLVIEFLNFISPGLYRREKLFSVSISVCSVILFYAGMAFAFYLVFPLIFSFFITSAPSEISVMTDISQYLDFVITILLAFGFAFEMPILILAIIWSDLASRESLSRARPYVIIGCFVVGMLLTPPDVISQTLLAVPTWILFELGLFVSRFIKK